MNKNTQPVKFKKSNRNKPYVKKDNQKPSKMNGRKLFSEIEQYIESRDRGEFNYYLSLIDPYRGVARIPAIIPVPSAVMQVKGSFTAVAPSTGVVRVTLAPHAGTTPIYYFASATTTDTILGTQTNVLSSSSYNTPFGRWRCTGALLRYIPVASEQTATGYYAAAFWPSHSGSPVKADALRDSDTAVTRRVMEQLSYSWRPLDDSDMEYRTNSTTTDSGSIQMHFSGLTAGMPLTFQYVINIEFLPAEDFTDNYDTSVAKGSVDKKIMSKISEGIKSWTGGSSLAKKLENGITDLAVSALSSRASFPFNALSNFIGKGGFFVDK